MDNFPLFVLINFVFFQRFNCICMAHHSAWRLVEMRYTLLLGTTMSAHNRSQCDSHNPFLVLRCWATILNSKTKVNQKCHVKMKLVENKFTTMYVCECIYLANLFNLIRCIEFDTLCLHQINCIFILVWSLYFSCSSSVRDACCEWIVAH